MKIWQIKDRPKSLVLSDAELIAAIKQGLLKGDDVLINSDLNEDVEIRNSIYAFYLNEDN